MRKFITILFGVCASAAFAQDADSTWKALRSTSGDWIGEGSGKPGEGTGEFSLRRELDGAILVRHNKSDYPAADGKPAVSHRDVMILYRREAQVRADYWDNEKHVIHYSVEAAADGSRIAMVSDAQPSAPRFRFTYVKQAADRMKVTFEIAPPGKPDQFAMYVAGTVRRQ
jgi:hypothetical protein